MCLLFETISIRNGKAENLFWHQERLNASYSAIFGKTADINLAEMLKIPPEARHGHFRCRVDYNHEIVEISYTPYQIKEIKSLRLVVDDQVAYPHKFADRSQLSQLFALRGDCDDVLIVKNEFITDTTFANIILWNGRQWLTPAEPLHHGTCRARLLAGGLIYRAAIKASELFLFSEVKLINAMRGMDDTVSTPVSRLK